MTARPRVRSAFPLRFCLGDELAKLPPEVLAQAPLWKRWLADRAVYTAHYAGGRMVDGEYQVQLRVRRNLWARALELLGMSRGPAGLVG